MTSFVESTQKSPVVSREKSQCPTYRATKSHLHVREVFKKGLNNFAEMFAGADGVFRTQLSQAKQHTQLHTFFHLHRLTITGWLTYTKPQWRTTTIKFHGMKVAWVIISHLPMKILKKKASKR
jgi:hypothetical protein